MLDARSGFHFVLLLSAPSRICKPRMEHEPSNGLGQKGRAQAQTGPGSKWGAGSKRAGPNGPGQVGQLISRWRPSPHLQQRLDYNASLGVPLLSSWPPSVQQPPTTTHTSLLLYF